MRAAASAAAALLLLAGCAELPRNAPPLDVMAEASIPGLPDVRTAAGRPSKVLTEDLERSFAQESRSDFPVGPDGIVHYPHLALSGGGPNGAFGAGLLKGWTATGTRPVFKIVTGVSTGALMAPFAYLGPAYDDALGDFYTTNASRNIFTRLSILPSLLGGEAFADTSPLRTLLEQHVDQRLLDAVADAHRRGRRLYVATTDLDSQRLVVWNMGAIAASGHPQALPLFRQVMLASASVPVAFPPVLFDVETRAGGRHYDELHVDGAVGANVFYNGGVFSFSEVRARASTLPGREDVFVVHNGKLLPEPAVTRRSVFGIALRSFDAVSKSRMVGDLIRIYAVTQREGATFHWITIPEDVDLTSRELFDPVAMGNLYALGEKVAREGPLWETEPPGFRHRLRGSSEAPQEP